MIVTDAQLFPICLPFAKEFSNAQSVLRERFGTLLRLVSDDGQVGWGEASPFPGFGLESLEESRSILTAAAQELLGKKIVLGDEWEVGIRELAASSGSAGAALETAVLDLVAQSRRQPMFELLTAAEQRPTPSIECNALVTGDGLDALERTARAEVANGFRSFKLKVAALDIEHDLARVARLRSVVGPSAEIRLDANQGYGIGVENALVALEAFARQRIEYLEQPLAAGAHDAMAALHRESPIPLAADESVACEADALRVIDAEAADVIVIKPSAVGGPSASLRIARAARRADIGVVITSLLDSAVGVSAAHQVALAVASEGALPACGLATAGLLARDVATLDPPLHGRLANPRPAGLGIRVDESRVRRCLAGPVVDLIP